MNVHECDCGPDRDPGEETGPSRNPHNNLTHRQFWCRRCAGVFSIQKPIDLLEADRG